MRIKNNDSTLLHSSKQVGVKKKPVGVECLHICFFFHLRFGTLTPHRVNKLRGKLVNVSLFFSFVCPSLHVGW